MTFAVLSLSLEPSCLHPFPLGTAAYPSKLNKSQSERLYLPLSLPTVTPHTTLSAVTASSSKLPGEAEKPSYMPTHTAETIQRLVYLFPVISL